MTSIESLNQYLAAQFEVWGRPEDRRKKIRAGPVIAITREPGCNGAAIAQELTKAFGLVVHDWEIVERIAENAHVSEQVVATLDEKVRSKLEEWLAGLGGDSSLSAHRYRQCLRRILFTIASHGNAVILGRGANFLLPADQRTIGLRLVAPIETRVRNTMQARRLSRETALKHIALTEQEQREWVRKNADADIDDATHYHLVINTALVTTPTLVRIVGEMLKVTLSPPADAG